MGWGGRPFFGKTKKRRNLLVGHFAKNRQRRGRGGVVWGGGVRNNVTKPHLMG